MLSSLNALSDNTVINSCKHVHMGFTTNTLTLNEICICILCILGFVYNIALYKTLCSILYKLSNSK